MPPASREVILCDTSVASLLADGDHARLVKLDGVDLELLAVTNAA
ncbi:MAG: hypothetical protein QM679_02575 [Patulibacter sp.]